MKNRNATLGEVGTGQRGGGNKILQNSTLKKRYCLFTRSATKATKIARTPLTKRKKLCNHSVTMVTILIQEVSIHVYEKRGTERVGRGRRKEAIAEILKVVAVMVVILVMMMSIPGGDDKAGSTFQSLAYSSPLWGKFPLKHFES